LTLILIVGNNLEAVNAYYSLLKFCHKESGEETSVGLVYFGKVERGERGPVRMVDPWNLEFREYNSP
jgi:hypothetical protein